MDNSRSLWIDGGWTPSKGGRVAEIVSPSTGEAYGDFVLGSVQDAEDAISASRRSFDDGRWRDLELAERGAVLEGARKRLESQVDEIAHVVTSEMGIPITQCRSNIAGRALNYIADVVERAPAILGPETVRDPRGTAVVWKDPIGVVAAIAPWNGPFAIATAKIFSALVTGCSVVFKPSPQTPLDVHFIAQALAEAGLPAGVLNIVPGDTAVGEAMVAHPDVDAVTFTGSTGAGRAIGEVCGRQLKRVCLELGGKSAAIVLDDADLVMAAGVITDAICGNSGQACISLSRILVPIELQDELVDAVRASFQSVTIGDPFDENTRMGPLVSAAHRARVESYIEIGKSEGARLAIDGGHPADLPAGWYLEPSLFVDGVNTMRIAREEIFGPVGLVIPYRSEEEAIAIANDSDFGLHGAVLASDTDRAMSVARRVRTGTLAINGYGFTIASPFGGIKQSGIGREHGDEGIRAMLEYKSVKLHESMTGSQWD